MDHDWVLGPGNLVLGVIGPIKPGIVPYASTAQIGPNRNGPSPIKEIFGYVRPTEQVGPVQETLLGLVG